MSLKLSLKGIDKDILYLFKVGNFYIFLDDDARLVSKYTTLKLIKYNKEIVKCGFPLDSLDKYLDIFKNIKLCVLVINNINNSNEVNKILNKIKNMDINNIKVIDSLNLIIKLKYYYNGRCFNI